MSRGLGSLVEATDLAGFCSVVGLTCVANDRSEEEGAKRGLGDLGDDETEREGDGAAAAAEGER